MAKKTKKSRISPKINIAIPNLPKFEDLEAGDCFILNNKLWIKDNSDDQTGICLEDGNVEDGLCDEFVIPVDVEIKWTKK